MREGVSDDPVRRTVDSVQFCQSIGYSLLEHAFPVFLLAYQVFFNLGDHPGSSQFVGQIILEYDAVCYRQLIACSVTNVSAGLYRDKLVPRSVDDVFKQPLEVSRGTFVALVFVPKPVIQRDGIETTYRLIPLCSLASSQTFRPAREHRSMRCGYRPLRVGIQA